MDDRPFKTISLEIPCGKNIYISFNLNVLPVLRLSIGAEADADADADAEMLFSRLGVAEAEGNPQRDGFPGEYGELFIFEGPRLLLHCDFINFVDKIKGLRNAVAKNFISHIEDIILILEDSRHSTLEGNTEPHINTVLTQIIECLRNIMLNPEKTQAQIVKLLDERDLHYKRAKRDGMATQVNSREIDMVIIINGHSSCRMEKKKINAPKFCLMTLAKVNDELNVVHDGLIVEMKKVFASSSSQPVSSIVDVAKRLRDEQKVYPNKICEDSIRVRCGSRSKSIEFTEQTFFGDINPAYFNTYEGIFVVTHGGYEDISSRILIPSDRKYMYLETTAFQKQIIDFESHQHHESTPPPQSWPPVDTVLNALREHFRDYENLVTEWENLKWQRILFCSSLEDALPVNWTIGGSDIISGVPFYTNIKTGETSWVTPDADDDNGDLVKGWEVTADPPAETSSAAAAPEEGDSSTTALYSIRSERSEGKKASCNPMTCRGIDVMVLQHYYDCIIKWEKEKKESAFDYFERDEDGIKIFIKEFKLTLDKKTEGFLMMLSEKRKKQLIRRSLKIVKSTNIGIVIKPGTFFPWMLSRDYQLVPSSYQFERCSVMLEKLKKTYPDNNVLAIFQGCRRIGDEGGMAGATDPLPYSSDNEGLYCDSGGGGRQNYKIKRKNTNKKKKNAYSKKKKNTRNRKNKKIKSCNNKK